MCGIIAVVRRPSGRPVPAHHEVIAPVERAVELAHTLGAVPDATVVAQVADALAGSDLLLRGVAGVSALVANGSLGAELTALLSEVDRVVAGIEARLDAGDITID